MGQHALSPGDEWPYHYRGFTLRVSPHENVWWQLYNGTDRLHLDPIPKDVVETLLSHKRIGGRIHITEVGDVLTRVEEGDEYTQLYLGNTSIDGTLTPPDNPEFSIEVHPLDLTPGDLWPSVYDGSRYSFVDDQIWWQNGSTHRRHPVTTDLPGDVMRELRSYKPSGGSFRITPWGDVITLVDMHPAPETVEKQFSELPRVVKNIIRLRKDQDVEMLPIYIGTIEDPSIETRKPKTLTDDMSDEEMEELSSWAKSLGRTTKTSATSHESSDHTSDRSATSTEETDPPTAGESTDTATEASDDDKSDKPPSFDDDPQAWLEDGLTSLDDDVRSGREK